MHCLHTVKYLLLGGLSIIPLLRAILQIFSCKVIYRQQLQLQTLVVEARTCSRTLLRLNTVVSPTGAGKSPSFIHRSSCNLQPYEYRLFATVATIKYIHLFLRYTPCTLCTPC